MVTNFPNGEIALQNSSVIAVRQAQGKLSDLRLSEAEILQDVIGIHYSSFVVNVDIMS
jgi:hypothetical protein